MIPNSGIKIKQNILRHSIFYKKKTADTPCNRRWEHGRPALDFPREEKQRRQTSTNFPGGLLGLFRKKDGT
jgi:hypothetical protein